MTGRYDILYKTYTNGVWSVSRNMTTSGQNASPWLIQLPNGTIGMFWSLKPANSYEIFYTHYVGSGWSTPVQITSTSFNDTQPSAAVGHDGRVWLVWTRVNSTNTSIPAIKQLYYKTLMNNLWSPEIQLTNDSNQNWGSCILIGKDNVVRVSWSKGVAGNNYQLYQKTYNGTAWTADTQIVSSSSTDEHPSMIQDRNGTLWLFWARLIVVSLTVQYYALFTKTSYNMGATWSSETQLTNTSTSVDSYMPSAAQSSYGTKSLWLFYSSNLNEPTYDIYALMSSGISPVHDVDLSAIHASNNLGTFWEYPGGLKSIGQSAIVTVSITVANLGDYGESINLSLTATNKTSTSLGTKTSFVGPGASVIVYYYWNTSGIKPARYGFSATVTPVPGEAYGNTFDNTLNLSNQTRIIPLGDVNQDGSIDIIDAGVCLAHFGWKDSSYYLLKYSDVDNAGYIDIIDVGVVEVNFGFVS